MIELTFEGNGKEMAEVLNRLSRSISKKSTMPILSTVAFCIEGGQLFATATNLEQHHRAVMPTASLSGDENAGCCVAMDRIAALFARCADGVVCVTLDGDEIAVSAGDRHARVKTLPIDGFPMTHGAAGDGVSCDADRLGCALATVAFAVSDDTTRHALNGVYLSGDGIAVATDGRRLASFRYGAEPCQSLDGVILPSSAVTSIVEMLDRQKLVKVATGGGGIVFRGEGEEFFTKLIDANYPNYRQVIPSFNHPVSLRVARHAIRHALEWCKVMQNGSDTTVKLSAEGSEITVSVTAPDVGEVEERVSLLAPIHGNIRVALNIRYLMGMVARDGGDEFILTTEIVRDGAVMGALIVSEVNEDFLGILMPMRF